MIEGKPMELIESSCIFCDKFPPVVIEHKRCRVLLKKELGEDPSRLSSTSWVLTLFLRRLLSNVLSSSVFDTEAECSRRRWGSLERCVGWDDGEAGEKDEAVSGAAALLDVVGGVSGVTARTVWSAKESGYILPCRS